LKLFLDSSVLVPVFLAEHPHHVPSPRLYTQCTPDIAFCASHSLAEVYSTLTRLPLPHRATPGQAIEFLESIHSRFRFVSLEGDDYFASIREAAANRIAGGAIYDALIARCAVQVGADQIFTWNTRHYQLLGAEISQRIKSPADFFQPF
jgi:predicted nucleic acid-binding protein